MFPVLLKLNLLFWLRSYTTLFFYSNLIKTSMFFYSPCIRIRRRELKRNLQNTILRVVQKTIGAGLIGNQKAEREGFVEGQWLLYFLVRETGGKVKIFIIWLRINISLNLKLQLIVLSIRVTRRPVSSRFDPVYKYGNISFYMKLQLILISRTKSKDFWKAKNVVFTSWNIKMIIFKK